MELGAILNVITTYVLPILAAVGTTAVGAAWLPPATPGTSWYYVRIVIDWLGQNYGSAKNVGK